MSEVEQQQQQKEKEKEKEKFSLRNIFRHKKEDSDGSSKRKSKNLSNRRSQSLENIDIPIDSNPSSPKTTANIDTTTYSAPSSHPSSSDGSLARGISLERSNSSNSVASAPTPSPLSAPSSATPTPVLLSATPVDVVSPVSITSATTETDTATTTTTTTSTPSSPSTPSSSSTTPPSTIQVIDNSVPNSVATEVQVIGSNKSSPQGADSLLDTNNRRSWSEQLDSDKENFVNDLNETSVLSHPSFCEPSRVKRIRVQNVTIIYNPMSGSKIGEKIMHEAKKYFEVHGIKVHVIPTEYKGHAEVLCRTLDVEGVDVICLVGGDGTIHEAVNGIMKRDPESRERFVMACLPAGTGNSFVLELQGKLSIKHVCERVVNGLTVPIDIAKVTIVGKNKISAECNKRRLEYDTLKKKFAHVNLDSPTLSSSQEAGRRSIQAYRQIRPDALMEYGSNLHNQSNDDESTDDSSPEPIYCFNSLHWGLGSKVNITAEKMRWMGKAVRYTTAALLELCRGEKILARIEYEDANGEITALEDEFCLAIVNNIQGAAKGMKMAPKAKLNDGLIDLILIKSHKTFDLMSVFTKVYDGTHTELDYVIYKQVKRFSITPFKKDKERKKRLRKEKKRIKAAIKAGREHAKNPLEILKTECNTILSELEDQIDEEIIDIDGELKGQTPFVCEMIPRSVRVVV
ncbi:hypothetical protein DICPUDRAFT_100067 [Dictyostelium purpureum]|uniref:DAGKc domain-containing protein n=1 Tax=Dictyostelium purpureum TaxID=5786 RepID=F1A557_DICPU|nr:uncharacterized protein DICPUDRAFT_100067 [Dictyostelium purpureum]EGC28677.1 hypothetical protein DICPUDRAFT_100067 [Dictyostelium purpureum]|eukprot:XP_003294801.1 hypothetical protein DICPUDRAFT_100067 [Dictyostelium purpureum]